MKTQMVPGYLHYTYIGADDRLVHASISLEVNVEPDGHPRSVWWLGHVMPVRKRRRRKKCKTK